MFNFLKPTLWKIIITFILLFVSGAIWRLYVTSHISDTFPVGFPFQFFLAWGPCPPGKDCSEFNGLFLIFDLLIWYVAGAFIVDRVRKRA